jgi:hypothetical protein
MIVSPSPRPEPFWRRAVLRTATAAWWSLCMVRSYRRDLQTAVSRRHRRRPAPMVDCLDFPAHRHPESLTTEMPAGDEEWLAGVAAALWPDDEYAAIVAAYLPGGES